MPELALFDLDGTLADTAADLGAALNVARVARGLPPLALDDLKAAIGSGMPALLRAGLGLEPDGPGYAEAREEVVTHYAAHIADETRLFPGITDLLDTLEVAGIDWGIVTNKPAQFTLPLLAALGLDKRALCVVSGDTLPERKPHPAPLLHAAALAGRAPAASVYLGDTELDVQAARAAGMPVVVAGWGYIGPDVEPAHWGADAIVQKPSQFASWVLARVGAARA
jgi:phosphoglycolate phosphatase